MVRFDISPDQHAAAQLLRDNRINQLDARHWHIDSDERMVIVTLDEADDLICTCSQTGQQTGQQAGRCSHVIAVRILTTDPFEGIPSEKDL